LKGNSPFYYLKKKDNKTHMQKLNIIFPLKVIKSFYCFEKNKNDKKSPLNQPLFFLFNGN